MIPPREKAKLKVPGAEIVAKVQATYGKARKEILSQLRRDGFSVEELVDLPTIVRLHQKAYPRD